ncbi:MAG: heavy-metal-associated domain-containing protein, partial [Anaerolineales bacterium]|nr:heavy-metal-associated domain-containing protein [Anaerolineales bacterium]
LFFCIVTGWLAAYSSIYPNTEIASLSIESDPMTRRLFVITTGNSTDPPDDITRWLEKRGYHASNSFYVKSYCLWQAICVESYAQVLILSF